MFALILDKFYDSGRFTQIYVDSFDKSLFFSISFTMEGSLLSIKSLVNLSPNIHTYIFAHKLAHRKGWGKCRSPKSYNLSLDCPFKMADKISMSQWSPASTSKRNEPAIYLK